jgi:hypothetical protein
MKVSPDIDLARSLRQVFGDSPDSAGQIAEDCARQTATVKALLQRFFARNERRRREMMILADEVGLGKTYVGLATAVSILDAIRRGEAPDGLPLKQPAVLILTPNNNALFNKWLREAEAFRQDCARRNMALDWLQIKCPRPLGPGSGNVIDLAEQARQATRRSPMLLIAKQNVLGAALGKRDWWRIRALLTVFRHFGLSSADRRYWCWRGRLFAHLGIPDLPELLDFRKAASLWSDEPFPKLEKAFASALAGSSKLQQRIRDALDSGDAAALLKWLDSLTRRAIARRMPKFPLVMIDEIHGLKNEYAQARRHFETLLSGRVSRVLGLSATPFQLRQEELLSILKLRKVLSVPADRAHALNESIDRLALAMQASRDCGDMFRHRWCRLRANDETIITEAWYSIAEAEESERLARAQQARPPRVAHALEAALELEARNHDLEQYLRPFVIRHQHPRGYREHFVGRFADAHNNNGDGSPHFNWAPGLEVNGRDELAHYLMMRAVTLAEDERGLPGLGAELTGSYRHLVETAAVWKKLTVAQNPTLRRYRSLLDQMIGQRNDVHDPDGEHRKIRATVRRALEFFKRGQKTLIFCVFTKTAEAVRDQLQAAITKYLNEQRERVFGNATTFENFRRRFFNRREPLYSLIQDHPLLGPVSRRDVGVPAGIALKLSDLREVARLLVDRGELPDVEKPDRRLLLAAVEHIAVQRWRASAGGQAWLDRVLLGCPELEDRMSEAAWLEAREPLSRSGRAGQVRRELDPEADTGAHDPLDAEHSDEAQIHSARLKSVEDSVSEWVRRLREDAIGAIVSPYFRGGVISHHASHLPLLARYPL